MRALAKPDPAFDYNPTVEINRLRSHRDAVASSVAESRKIPEPSNGHVVIGSWNIANLGVHKRRIEDLKVITEILSWFEIVAIQEIADNLDDFLTITQLLPEHFNYVFTDRAGNDERAGYIYDTRRIALGPKTGEVVIVDNDRQHIKLPGIDIGFDGFNRNPFLATFGIEEHWLLLANCHLVFGKSGNKAEKTKAIQQRQLEAYAIARWCDLRGDDKHAFTDNIIALGDFNLLRAEPNDPMFQALTKRGLTIPAHQTRIPTNVSNTYDYDQITVTPHLDDRITNMGVFDFDAVIFAHIYDHQKPGYWRKCAKYYISDHRPIWIQLALRSPDSQ